MMPTAPDDRARLLGFGGVLLVAAVGGAADLAAGLGVPFEPLLSR